MTVLEITEYLKQLAEATISVANASDTGQGSKVRLTMQASVLLEACDTMLKQTGELEQLRERLVRQACWLEQFEARAEPKTWPLLNDDGCDDAGAAL